MKTVSEVSKIAGVSVRTLQYYDKIGLLKPAKYTQTGYRLYDDECLARLQQILLFRELEFPLEEIKEILQDPDFDRDAALEEQIKILEMKKNRLEDLINFAREVRFKGETKMDFSVFDKRKIEEYTKEAKEKWGKTEQFKESEEKLSARTDEENEAVHKNFMNVFAEFGNFKDLAPESDEVQVQVKKLQDYISEHYYKCSDKMLAGLGQMYVADERFKANIDAAGGEGTAEFVARAIGSK